MIEVGWESLVRNTTILQRVGRPENNMPQGKHKMERKEKRTIGMHKRLGYHWQYFISNFKNDDPELILNFQKE